MIDDDADDRADGNRRMGRIKPRPFEMIRRPVTNRVFCAGKSVRSVSDLNAVVIDWITGRILSLDAPTSSYENGKSRCAARKFSISFSDGSNMVNIDYPTAESKVSA